MGSKEQQRITCHRQCPDWPFLFLCLVPLNLNLPAKFDIFIFILTGDNRWVPKFKSRSRDLRHAPFWPNFSFFVQYSLPSIRLQNLTFVAASEPEIIGGPKTPKVGHVTQATPPFGPIFDFLFSIPTLDPSAKFDVCSFIRTGDNRGVPKFKSRSRDLGHAPFRPFFYFLFSIPYPRPGCQI